LCDFCLQIFTHKNHEDLLGHDLQKKVFMCFCVFLQTLGAIFLNFQVFCSHFQRFCQDFPQIKTFGVALEPPPLTPLLLSMKQWCWAARWSQRFIGCYPQQSRHKTETHPFKLNKNTQNAKHFTQTEVETFAA